MASSPEKIGSDSGEEVDVSDDSSNPDVTQIMNRPDILAVLQGRDHFTNLRNLPPAVKRRIKALKKLQLETTNIEARFFEEVHKLECKYNELFEPLYSKREEIVNGKYEPNDAECDFPSDDEAEDEDPDATKTDNKEEAKENVEKEEPSGVPEFWLTIFKNVAMLSDMVQCHDEPILKHLVDVKVIFLPADPVGFKLEFHFSENEYFANSVLVKEYEMKCKPDENDPFSYEGPEIFKCKGCTIDWHPGKNVTLKTVKKKQKHKSRGSVRTVTKTVPNESFFNFFSPPNIPEDENETDLDEDTQAILTSDFEVGHYIRERIVPRAVLYYTGEALEDEDDFEDEEDEDEEEEYEEEEEQQKHETETSDKFETRTEEIVKEAEKTD